MIKVKYCKVIFFLLLVFNRAAGDCMAQLPSLPFVVSPENTELTFEVDSTWHLVKGNVKQLSGKLDSSSPNDLAGLNGEIHALVSSFDTSNGRRDDKLMEVMEAKTYPEVKFKILKTSVSPHLQSDGGRQIELTGELTIRNVTRPWALKGYLVLSEQGCNVLAQGRLLWADFGVADPSILIAKLSPEVLVKVSLDCKQRSQ